MIGSPRILVAIVMAWLIQSPAAVSEEVAQRLTEALPDAPAGWRSSGPETQVTEGGADQGVTAFQIYQGPVDRWVVVRIEDEPPAEVERLVDDPAAFDLESATIAGRRAAVQVTHKGGNLIIREGAHLVTVRWGPSTPRRDAESFAKLVDYDGLTEIE